MVNYPNHDSLRGAYPANVWDQVAHLGVEVSERVATLGGVVFHDGYTISNRGKSGLRIAKEVGNGAHLQITEDQAGYHGEVCPDESVAEELIARIDTVSLDVNPFELRGESVLEQLEHCASILGMRSVAAVPELANRTTIAA